MVGHVIAPWAARAHRPIGDQRNSRAAAKSSVQELTNGLLARGYLLEDDSRFHLGPGPFILAAQRTTSPRCPWTTGSSSS